MWTFRNCGMNEWMCLLLHLNSVLSLPCLAVITYFSLFHASLISNTLTYHLHCCLDHIFLLVHTPSKVPHCSWDNGVRIPCRLTHISLQPHLCHGLLHTDELKNYSALMLVFLASVSFVCLFYKCWGTYSVLDSVLDAEDTIHRTKFFPSRNL